MGRARSVVRRRRVAIGFGAGLLAVLGVVFPLVARAAGSDSQLESAASRLQQLTDFFDNAASAAQWAQTVPLSNLTPKDALALADTFDDDGAAGDSLKDKLASIGTIGDTNEFQSKLDALDFTTPGGVHVAVGGPTSDGGDGVPVVRKNSDNSVDIGLHVTITKTVDVPLAFSTSLMDLAADGTDGTFPVTFTLGTNDIQFHYDDALNSDPGTAADAVWIDRQPDNTLFSGGTAPKVTASVAAANTPLATLHTNLGFTAVDVTGALDFDFGYSLEILDPDASGGNPGDGKVSATELTTTAPEDLLQGGLTDNGSTNAVHAALSVDSDLIPGSPDTTITYTDPSLLVSGDETTIIPSNPIDDFKNFSAQDALGAIMRLVSMLNGIQGTGRLDISLPFITGKTNAVDPSAAADGSFSDVLRLSNKVLFAVTDPPNDPNPSDVDIAEPSSDPANPNALGTPKFANAQALAVALETALGLSAGTISLDYDETNKRLSFGLDLKDDYTTQANLDFGDLDILSAVQIETGGVVNLDASYDLPLTFALDLNSEPTEPGGGIGSCADGVDNDNANGMDAADPACATARTLEQRVAIDVGASAGQPEVTARLGVTASNVDAQANIGLLQAGIDNADLVVGSKHGEASGGADDPTTCSDGTDNDGDGKTDMADPDCEATVTLDLVDSGDGWLSIQDVLNALGSSPPSGVSLTAHLNAGMDSTVPVSAQLGGSSLGGGDIAISGNFDANIDSPSDFVDPANGNIAIDASDLHASDLFDFSPCSNSKDDDGDGTVNDGCDGGPAAVDAPESASTALFSKIVAAIHALANQFDNLGIFPAGTLDQDLPLVGVSFNDLVSFADTLSQTADSASHPAESDGSANGGPNCTNTTDDDGDGVVNDGCPTASGGSDPAPGLPESDCVDQDLPSAGYNATPADDDGDGVVNDGCQPALPSLQKVGQLLEAKITQLLAPVDPSPTVTVDIGYDNTTQDVTFQAHIALSHEFASSFTLGSLPGILGTLVSVDPLDASLTLNADLQLGFGVNLDDFKPFILGNSALDLSAAVVGQDLAFNAGAGSLTIGVGQPGSGTPEDNGAGQCSNNTDDDGDGYVNDGCPAMPNPETGTQCTASGSVGVDNDGDGKADDGCPGNTPPAKDTAESGTDCTDPAHQGVDDDGDGIADDGCGQPNLPAVAGSGGDSESDGTPDGGANCSISNTTDDDNDGVVNDGCPTRADKGRFFLGAHLNLFAGTASGDDDTHYSLDGSGTPISFGGDFGGSDQSGCSDVVITSPLVGSPVGASDDKFGCAILPLYFNDNPIGTAPDGHHVKLAVTSFDPLAVSVEYDTSQLESLISSNLLDLVLANSGIDSLLNSLQSLLESDLFSFALPLIGGQTATAAGIVDDLRNTIKSAISTAVSGGNPLNGAVGADTVKTVLDNLASSITTAITGGGLTTSPATVELFCGTAEDRGCDTGYGEADPNNPAISGGGTAANCDDPGTPGADTKGNGVDDDGDGVVDDGCADGPNAAPAAEPALNVSDVRLTFDISGSVDLFNAPVNFDIGIPGLGLKGDLHPQGTIDWSIKFGFGVGKNEGFYFFTGNDPEVGVGLNVKLSPDQSNPSSLQGTLGFLQVDVVDGDPVDTCPSTDVTDPVPCRRGTDTTVDPISHLGANFTVDIKDPGPTNDDKLTFSELSQGPSFSDMITFGLTADAAVNLHIETGFPGGAGLPKLIADLHLNWNWGISSATDTDALKPSGSGSDSDLSVNLTDVGLDVGTYVTKFLKPIFSDVKRFTDPLKPVIDTVTACIPVLTDLSGSCVSLLTLAEQLNLGGINYDFIKQVIGIIKFIQALPTEAPGNLVIPIGDGSFNLAGDTLQAGALPPEGAQSAFAENINGLPSILGDMNGNSFVAGQGGSDTSENGIDAPAVKADSLGDIGVTFPFLEHPEKLLGVLFGQDVDLVVWQPHELSISFSYSQKFGPIWAVPPVFIEIGGSVSVTGRFGIGYSSKGFRNWLMNDQGPAALLQGLFLVDKHPLEGGPDSNELELHGELFANAQVSVLIFSAGAQGSIYLTIGIDLQDPNGDGRLEYTEAADIIRTTGNVLCIFNLNGQFGVKISVFAEIDLFFWSQRWEFTLADIVLYEFKVECKPLPDPVLARVDAGVLKLNIGPDRYLRDPEEYSSPPYVVDAGFNAADHGFTNSADGTPDNSVGSDVKEENYKLVRVDLGSGNFGVQVTALGVTQVYTGVTSVSGDGGDENDKITESDGPAKDGSKLVFNLPSTLKGGTGDDEIVGSMANDTLFGGDGNDKLTGRDGVNTIHGDNADGTGTGNDVIDSGGGDDFLYGEGGDDRISAGTGADKVVGGDGSDNLDGGRSTPSVTDGNDTMFGDKEDGTGTGDDHIDGNDGNDVINTGGGKDRADGGAGTDTIVAFGSSDPACSGNLDDVLIGGADADSISAGDGDDIVIGGGVLAGTADTGDTKLDGENGCDTIFGDNAVQGPSGPFDVSAIDPTIGGADTILGGNQADLIHGQLGGDVIHGDDDVAANDTDDGNDTIWGEEPGNAAGDDIVHADGGNDVVYGSAGNDDLIGGTGDDTIYGEADQDFILGDDGDVTRTGARDANDAVFGGGNGADHLYGGGARDHVYAQGGADYVQGDGGDDALYGDTDEAANAGLDANDTVYGGVGNDLISGGNADDDLNGEAGNDRMIGGYVVDAPDSGVRGDGFQDHMYGGTGTDVMTGDDATISDDAVPVVNLISEAAKGDADLMYGGDDADRMFGENGNDTIHGDNADDHVEGGDDSDTIYGDVGNDDLIGGTTEAADGHATGFQPDAGDIITGGTGADVMLGDNGSITRPGGTRPDGAPNRTVVLYDLDDTSGLYSGEDTVNGNESYDDAYGGAEHDTIHGNTEDDHLEGNNGNDDLSGDAGQDDLIGGTSAEVDEVAGLSGDHPDTGKDVIHGNEDADVACGDNCSIRRFANDTSTDWVKDDLDTSRGYTGVVRRQVQLYDVATLATTPVAGSSDGDELYGDAAYDILYGQGGDDLMKGGAGDDHLEGNAGHDTVYGEGGQDDVIGGTGRTTSDDPATAADGRLDTNDDLYGGDGAGGVSAGDDFDVVMGDNATVLRGSPFPTPTAGSAWDVNTFNASIKRAVYLYDVATVTNPVDAATNGPDVMRGEADDDVMYGQGDNDDMEGAAGDDYMEGNDGADTVKGQDGNDDVVGGTGRINTDPPEGTNGRLDLGEADLSGGPGFDWIAGDNAIVTRVLGSGGQWLPNTFNNGIRHNQIWLLDVNSPNEDVVSGGDVINGNEDDDVLYGQGNRGDFGTVFDVMHGNDGDDYMEGNAGDDRMFGDAGQDDMVGGTGRINAHLGGNPGTTQQDGPDGNAGRWDRQDYLFGGDGHDVMTGDNAVVGRPLTSGGAWVLKTYQHFFDHAVSGSFSRVDRTVAMPDSTVGPTSGSDIVNGEDGDDELYGQLDDTSDNTNTSTVTVLCDGSTAANVTDPKSDKFGQLVTTAGDLVCGGAGEDGMLGDQGFITDVPRTSNGVIDSNGAPFMHEEYPAGMLTRQTTLTQITTGGDDVLLGGDDHDSMHGGAGLDVANGNNGDDVIFGDDGVDAVWGGPDHDQTYGGYGNDFLDVHPRSTSIEPGGDPASWWLFSPDVHVTTGCNPGIVDCFQGFAGIDWIYGGYDQDALQANVGDNGPVEGDRLLDWSGSYNAYYLCPSTYGEYVSTRQMSPSMLTYMQNQATLDGAVNVGTSTNHTVSGSDELALVYKPDVKNNTNPVHPDTPAHFTCE